MAGLRTNKTQVPNEVDETVEGSTPETTTTTPADVTVRTPSDVTVAMKVAPALTSLENAYDPEEFGNVFPRLVGANGAICVSGDTLNFGEFIDVQVLSHSDRWMVTPDADAKDKQAKKFCRASYDGKTIPDRDGGPSVTIEDYIASVDGYEFNPVSKYKDIFALVFNSHKNAEEAAEKGIVQISVSPSVLKDLRAFMMQTKLAVMTKRMLPSHQNCLRIRAEAKSNDNGNYTVLKFEHVPLDVAQLYTPVIDSN